MNGRDWAEKHHEREREIELERERERESPVRHKTTPRRFKHKTWRLLLVLFHQSLQCHTLTRHLIKHDKEGEEERATSKHCPFLPLMP